MCTVEQKADNLCDILFSRATIRRFNQKINQSIYLFVAEISTTACPVRLFRCKDDGSYLI